MTPQDKLANLSALGDLCMAAPSIHTITVAEGLLQLLNIADDEASDDDFYNAFQTAVGEFGVFPAWPPVS